MLGVTLDEACEQMTSKQILPRMGTCEEVGCRMQSIDLCCHRCHLRWFQFIRWTGTSDRLSAICPFWAYVRILT